MWCVGMRLPYHISTAIFSSLAAVQCECRHGRVCCITAAGPFSLPLIGDLPWIVKYGMHEYGWRCQQKYGKIFKVRQSLCVVAAGSHTGLRDTQHSLVWSPVVL
jgi:hypothetical protein